MEVKRIDGDDENSWKYVFNFEDVLVDAFLYRFGTFSEKTVICISSQSFERNLTHDEMLQQVQYLIGAAEAVDEINLDSFFPTLDAACKNLHIMFMSMGEPMLNWDSVESVIRTINKLYKNAKILISTIGVNDDDTLFKILTLSASIKKLRLEFNLFDAFEEDRNKIGPHIEKLSLRDMRNYGLYWSIVTGRAVLINYHVSEFSARKEKLERLIDVFDQEHFKFKFTDASYDKEQFLNINEIFLVHGYITEIQELTKSFK